MTFEALSEQAEVEQGIDSSSTPHAQPHGQDRVHDRPEMASFFRRMTSAMAARGADSPLLLSINGGPPPRCCASTPAATLYMYNSGYDPAYFGNLAVGLVSKALCCSGRSRTARAALDFLRGDEPYKYDLGAKDQEIYRVVSR